MSNDLSDWGDPQHSKNGNHLPTWNVVWKIIVSVAGLVLIFYEAMFAPEVNFGIVLASLLMMGFPVARWLDKLQ